MVSERSEPLHQPEEAMLAWVETLNRGRIEESSNRMTEALRHLIKVRRTFQFVIGNGGERARAARAFDRRMAQKLREALGETVRDGVLQPLGLLVDLLPGVPEMLQ